MSATTGMSAAPASEITGTSSEKPSTKQPKKKSTIWLKRLIQLLTVLALIGCLLYFITPFAARYLISNKLEQAGMTNVYVDAIGWRPWIPSVSFGQLSWTTPDQDQVNLDNASLELSWPELLNRHVNVKSIRLSGLKLPIVMHNELKIAGLTLPKNETPSDEPAAADPSQNHSWHFSVTNLTLANSQITLDGAPVPITIFKPQQHMLTIDLLKVADFSTLTPLEKSNLTFAGTIDDLKFKIDADGAILANSQSLNAEIDLLQTTVFDRASQWLQPEVLNGIKGTGFLDFNLSMDHQNTPAGRQMAFQLNITTPKLQGTLSKNLRTPTNISVENFNLNFGLSLGLAPPGFSASFNSELKADTISATNQDFTASVTEFAVQTKLLETQGQLTSLEQTNAHLESEVRAKALSLETKNIAPILSLSNFETTGALQGRQITIPNLKLDQLFILGSAEPLIKKLNMERLVYGRDALNEKALNIETLELTDLNPRLQINPDGSLEIQNILNDLMEKLTSLLPEPDVQTANEVPPAMPKSQIPLQWAINEFKLVGQNSINIFDNRKGFGVDHRIDFDKMTFLQLGLADATEVDVLATFAQGGNLTIKGQFTLADLQANTNINAVLSSLAVPPLSPYIASVLGYSANTGLLDANLKLVTQAGQGDSTLIIEAHKLEMTPVNQAVIASLTQELTMPLDLSLSLLKNKDDTIKLEIPIQMTSAGVDAKIGTVVRQAITRATKNASLIYLKYALQPYGSILLLAEKSGDLLNEMQLVNIKFDAMSATIGPNQADPAKKIIDVLQQKPNLKIRLCPTATKEEIQNWPKEAETDQKKALQTLALQRAQSIKRYFISQDIQENRLFVCAPKINASGVGEVLISL